MDVVALSLAKKYTNEKLKGVFDPFSTTKAYAKGEVVLYNNIVYQFKEAKPAGAWDATKVDQLDVSELIERTQGKVEELKYDIIEGEVIPAVSVNLTTADKTNSSETWKTRTTGGNNSIANGASFVEKLEGNSSRTVSDSGFTATTTIESESITSATVNAATFAEWGLFHASSGVAPGGGLGIRYSEAQTSWVWGAEPTTVALTDLGVEITGTPANGDVIIIALEENNHGTITSANPTKFTSTGINEYNGINGFDISGAVQGLTIDANGNFVNDPTKSVGFVWVTSGTNDWILGHREAIDRVAYCATKPTAPYSEQLTILTEHSANSSIGAYDGQAYYNSAYTIANAGWLVFTGSDLSLVCTHPHWSGEDNWREGGNSDYVPYFEKVITFTGKSKTKNIETQAYSYAALATLLTANPTYVKGTDYDYDNTYIYTVAQTPTTVTYDNVLRKLGTVVDVLAVNESSYANDYGVETFDGDLAVTAYIQYNTNLKDQLRHSVRYDSQTLTSAQQDQAITNLGITNANLNFTLSDGTTVVLGALTK